MTRSVMQFKFVDACVHKTAGESRKKVSMSIKVTYGPSDAAATAAAAAAARTHVGGKWVFFGRCWRSTIGIYLNWRLGGRRLELCDDTWKQRRRLFVERRRLLQTVSGFQIFFFFEKKKGSLQTDTHDTSMWTSADLSLSVAEEINGFFIPRRNSDKSNTFLICNGKTPNPVDERQQQTFISNPPDPTARARQRQNTCLWL